MLEKGWENLMKSTQNLSQHSTQTSSTLTTFIQQTGQTLASNTQAISRLEIQLGQLATQIGERERGKFPSQPEPNPKGVNNQGQYFAQSSTHGAQHDQVNALTTLRSGR